MLLWGVGTLWAPLAEYFGLGLAITAASVAFLIKDFFIRHAYNTRNEHQAFVVNITLAISLVLLLTALHFSNRAITVILALAVYAISHVFAAGSGFLKSHRLLRTWNLDQLKADFIEAWECGRWALTQNLVFWLRSQAHTYVSVIYAGAGAVGLINAARLLIAPVQFLIPAISQIILPRLSSARSDIPRALKLTKITSGFLFLASLLYTVILLTNLDLISKFALGKNYLDNNAIKALAVSWCLVICSCSSIDFWIFGSVV